MGVTVTLVEPALGASLTEGGQPAAFAGLVVVALAETVGLVRFSTFLECALPDGDPKWLEICHVGDAVLKGLTGAAPLLVVAVAQAPGSNDPWAVREGTRPQAIVSSDVLVVVGRIPLEWGELGPVPISGAQLLLVAAAQTMRIVAAATPLEFAQAVLGGV